MKLFAKPPRTANRGQAILLVALAMVAVAAFVGLMTDVGVLFIEYGKLKRGIDSGAIAAAQQFRRFFTGEDLRMAATNFLALNDTSATTLNVFRCKEDPSLADGTMHDATLCAASGELPRKLIRLEAERWVNFGFLKVIGIPGTTIRASSVGEAASVDLVLVIDTSSSMSYETGGNPDYPDNALDDPAVCNYSLTNPCQPLTQVKNSALAFIDTLFFPYDRVSIVTMTSQTPGGSRDHTTVLPLSNDRTTVANAISSLRVFEPPNCATNPVYGFCLLYDTDGDPATYEASGTFLGLDCPARWNPVDGNPPDEDPSSCPSSNIGGALWRAGAEFTQPGYLRDESFWAIVLLAGGPANATDSDVSHPYGYCPASTWDTVGVPWCRDALISTRHSPGPPTDPEFDADDFARWKADQLTDPVNGNGITIFTIGLGKFVREAPAGDALAGEALLTYIAREAGDCTTCAPPYLAVHGTYSYAPTAAGLVAIFEDIAENIFTRIAR